MEYIVITGVSTGIGYDAARYLIDKGFYISTELFVAVEEYVNKGYKN